MCYDRGQVFFLRNKKKNEIGFRPPFLYIFKQSLMDDHPNTTFELHNVRTIATVKSIARLYLLSLTILEVTQEKDSSLNYCWK